MADHALQGTGIDTATPGAPKRLSPRDLLSTVQVSRPQVSPDGRWVVFQTERALIEQNAWAADLWLVDAYGTQEPRQLTAETLRRVEPGRHGNAFAFQWTPDSSSVTLFRADAPGELVRLALDGGTSAALDTEGAVTAVGEYPTGAMSFSPDGRFLAYLVAPAPTPARSGDALRGIEVDPRRGPLFLSAALRPGAVELRVLEIGSAKVVALTDQRLSVVDFAWSPDSLRLVVIADERAAETEDWIPSLRDTENEGTHVYLMDRAGGEPTTLVPGPGSKVSPCWSPDGRWIAYLSHVDGFDLLQHHLPAVVSPESGELHFLGAKGRDVIGSVYPDRPVWSADSRYLHVVAGDRMRLHLYRAAVPDGEFERVSPDGDVLYHGPSSRSHARA